MYLLEQGNVDDDATFMTIFLLSISFNLQSCYLMESTVCKCHTPGQPGHTRRLLQPLKNEILQLDDHVLLQIRAE